MSDRHYMASLRNSVIAFTDSTLPGVLGQMVNGKVTADRVQSIHVSGEDIDDQIIPSGVYLSDDSFLAQVPKHWPALKG